MNSGEVESTNRAGDWLEPRSTKRRKGGSDAKLVQMFVSFVRVRIGSKVRIPFVGWYCDAADLLSSIRSPFSSLISNEYNIKKKQNLLLFYGRD